jgi:hypothetical protein
VPANSGAVSRRPAASLLKKKRNRGDKAERAIGGNLIGSPGLNQRQGLEDRAGFLPLCNLTNFEELQDERVDETFY